MLTPLCRWIGAVSLLCGGVLQLMRYRKRNADLCGYSIRATHGL